MGKWMRFAIDRKRQIFAAAAAGLGAGLMLSVMTQRAMARTYVITDGQRVVTCTTFATDPDRVLDEAGVELGSLDSYDLGGRDIRVSRSCQVTVRYHGQERHVTSQGETVEALLKRWGIEGDWVGVGHCILGYAANEAPAPKPRKKDYVINR